MELKDQYSFEVKGRKKNTINTNASHNLWRCSKKQFSCLMLGEVIARVSDPGHLSFAD